MLGLVAGWLTGRWDVALPLAVFFELFWLDVIRLGAIVPPSGALSFLLLFPLILLLHIQTPAELALPLLLCVPAAYAVSRLERALRERNNAAIDEVSRWCAHASPAHGTSPERVVWRALGWHGLTNALLFVLSFGLVYAVLRTVQAFGLPVAPGLSWNVLYGAGLMGAVLALRIRRAYAVLGVVLTAIVLMHM